MTSDFFSFTSKPQVNGFDTVWVNDEESKIPIIDGKITFHDKNTGAKFSLYVTQVKGRGTADADKLTILSDKHKLILGFYIQWENNYTALSLKTLVERYFTSKKRDVDPNHYNRTISELLRKKCLSIDDQKPPHYSITDIGRKSLESGKFE